jgi:hypothetical protein
MSTQRTIQADFLETETGILTLPQNFTGVLNAVKKTTTEINFGSVGDFVKVTVAASWVEAGSVMVLQLTPNLTDHDYDDVILEGLRATYGNIVVGISFDVYVHAPEGTWGRYNVIALAI